MKVPKLSLTAQIFICLIAGVIVGLIFGDACAALQPLKDAFIKLIQITVLPSVVVSVISGIGDLKQSDAKLIARKGSFVLLMIWSLGIIAFFSMQLAFPAILNASFFSSSDIPNSSNIDLTDLLIPSNFFRSLSDGAIPAIVLFSLLLGFTLLGDDKNRPLLDLLKGLSSALSRMTNLVSRIIPLGVFVIVANIAGTLTFERLLELQVFIITIVVLAAIIVLVILPLMIYSFLPFTYGEILSASSKAILLGFSTGNGFIALPMIAESVQNLFKGQNDRERLKSYSEVLVPLAYSFPLLGTFPPFIFILFTAWFYQHPLDFNQQTSLVLAGLPSLFSNTMVSVQFLLNLMGLPADALSLYLSGFSFQIYFATAMNCMSNFAFAVICAALLTESIKFSPKRAIFSITIIVAVFAAAIAGLNLGFSHMLADTYKGEEVVAYMDMPSQGNSSLINSSLDVKVYKSLKDIPADDPARAYKDVLSRIKKRDALKVGYNADCMPFAFFNKKGKLVGYDIQMAYDLAHYLNVSGLEFIPITGDTMAKQLESGQCDIVMSSIYVTPERLDTMAFTSPYMTLHMAMVVMDNKKDKFTSLENIRRMSHLRVAVLNQTALANQAPLLFPNASIVLVDSFNDFFTGDRADALLTTAEEGSVMTLLYPFYTVAMLEPSDSYMVLCAYATAIHHSDSFLLLLNYWLKMDEDYGVLERRYDYWILGKGVEKEPPRWCVVRDVLHWVA